MRLAACLPLILLATSASAAFADTTEAGSEPWRRHDMVPYGEYDAATHGGTISHILYVNRCAGGCEIVYSEQDNALTNESSVPGGNSPPPSGTMFTLQEFGHGDAVWEEIMSCVRQVYAPYDVTVTDEDPGQVPHHENMAAGAPSQIDYPSAGGVAPSGCSPRNNVISYSFLNTYPASQVNEMCATIAQESAHSFGLGDHLYDCTDPMTYLALSGECGRKFFRNKLEQCGEFQPAACNCTGQRMNPHVTLLGTFGPGEDPPPPEATLTYPADGATITASSVVSVNATDDRGVYKVEAYLNDWLWGTYTLPDTITPPFSYPTTISVDLEDGYPDGAYEIHAIAYNDLGIATTTESVNVMKGAACTSADSCLEGQTCESGGCRWAEPTGEVGDECTYDEFCVGSGAFDGNCGNVGLDHNICTESCIVGVNDTCPVGFSCVEGANLCGPEPEDTGCCSTGSDGRGDVLARLAMIGIVGLFLVRRRRK